jgi:hypothetical protein
MKSRLGSGVAICAALFVTIGACGGDDSGDQLGTGGSAGSGGKAGSAGSADGGSGGEPSGSGGEGGGAPSVNAADVGFTPSNLPSDLDLPVNQDMIFNGETCASRAEIDTDTGEIRCYEPGLVDRAPYHAFAVVEQEDGSEVAVFAANNIVADAQVRIEVVGQRPLVFLAPGNITLRGQIQVIADSIYETEANGGGFSSPTAAATKGLGPGGGGPGSASAGGGGATYCGKGGKGGGSSGAVGASGAVYGAPEITPLLGGSSGGSGITADTGAGGGAIQVVAGGKLTISATGVIHVGGAGGNWGGSGGGSGGAILLEAPEVSIAGILAANGGGGGAASSAGDMGSNSSPDENFAPGGIGSGATAETTGKGGNGSTGADAAGTAGGSEGGGGGGGAGRIRVNTLGGGATISGTLSPSVATGCASEGEIAP